MQLFDRKKNIGFISNLIFIIFSLIKLFLIFTIFNYAFLINGNAAEVVFSDKKASLELKARTSKKCLLSLPEYYDWRPQEVWAWEERLCIGLVADMAEFPHKSKDKISCNSKDGKIWSETQILSRKFIETIMTNEKYVSMISHKGIRIRCAWINNGFDVSYSTVNFPIEIINSKLDGFVNMYLFKSSGSVSLRSCQLSAIVEAEGINISGDLDLSDTNNAGVWLYLADISGNIYFSSSDTSGYLNAGNIKVGGNLYLDDNAQFTDIFLGSGHIKGNIYLNDSTVKDRFTADDIQIDGVFDLSGSKFHTVSMYDAIIKSSFLLRRTLINGLLTAQRIDIGGAFLAENAQFTEIGIDSSVVKGDFNLRGSEVRVSLTADSLKVGNAFVLTYSRLQELNINDAEISGSVYMDSIKISGDLYAQRIGAGGLLRISNKAIIEKDLNLYGATVKGSVELGGININGNLIAQNIDVGGDIFLNNSTIKKNLELFGTTVEGSVELGGININGNLIGGNVEVGGDLNLNKSATVSNVDLTDGFIKSSLDMNKCIVINSVNADRLHVGGSFFLNGCKIKEISIQKTFIGDSLNIEDGQFANRIEASRLLVASDLTITDVTSIKSLDLKYANVNGNTTISGASIEKLIAHDMVVGQNLFLDDGSEFHEVNLISVSVGTDLFMNNSYFKAWVFLTGAKVTGKLHMGSLQSGNPHWGKEAFFDIRNLKVGILQDSSNSWDLKSGSVNMIGFEYQNIADSGELGSDSMAERSVKWLIEWLSKQQGFNERYYPQPFNQLSDALKNAGQEDKAISILIEAKNHQRRSPSTSFGKKLWMTILWLIINYGYGSWRSLLWLVFLVLVGMFIFKKAFFYKKGKLIAAAYFSLDLALPIINLNPIHDKIKLSGICLFMSYFYKISGFILVSFLIAGLSGLTK